eukprot:TRINITY_DN18643_c0_g1_i1.p1 TRINITY_DN18643_c0_g1~~TRINITY_DN18643_c0_g1_i1.p1  ORF type:complete len:558 (-),score=88.10 TRINITY_DN18643_c0_g1_i1:220-1827(-)
MALPLTKTRYCVGCAWDSISESVDIDVQAVIVDRHGLIVDAVYYNNLNALNRAITHSGDSCDGHYEGIDEFIWVNLSMVPHDVCMIIFVVAAYNYGQLNSAANGQIILVEEMMGNRIKQVPMERSSADVDAVSLIRRTHNGWVYQIIEEKAEMGSHFLDIIEPTLGNLIRKHIHGAPKEQRMRFVMDKGSMAELSNHSLKRMVVGIGGRLHPRSPPVDIDITALFFGNKGEQLGVVDGKHPEKYGVIHGGNEVAGASKRTAMDDEVIMIDTEQIPRKVAQIFFIMTVCRGTFESLRSAYARVCDQDCHEMARYDIEAGHSEKVLVVARLVKLSGEGKKIRFGFQAIGKFVKTDEHGWNNVLVVLDQMFQRSLERKAEDDENGYEFGKMESLKPAPAEETIRAESATKRRSTGEHINNFKHSITEDVVQAPVQSSVGQDSCNATEKPKKTVAGVTGNFKIKAYCAVAAKSLGNKEETRPATSKSALGGSKSSITLCHDDADAASEQRIVGDERLDAPVTEENRQTCFFSFLTPCGS